MIVHMRKVKLKKECFNVIKIPDLTLTQNFSVLFYYEML